MRVTFCDSGSGESYPGGCSLALAVYVEIPVPRHAPWWGHAVSRGKSRGQVLLWYLMEHVVG